MVETQDSTKKQVFVESYGYGARFYKQFSFHGNIIIFNNNC